MPLDSSRHSLYTIRLLNMGKDEKQLLDYFASLDASGRNSLLEFAAFLSSRGTRTPVSETSNTVQEPVSIERPETESVVGAIKRLSETYPMLEKKHLIHEISGLMAQHMLQGRVASEVIDELEMVFRKHYERHIGMEQD